MAILAIILAALLVASFFLSALFLWLGALVLRAPKAGFLRAAIATIIASVLYLPYALFAAWMRQEFSHDHDLTSSIMRELLVLFLYILATIVLIMRMFDTSFLRAVAIWLINLIPAVVLVPVLLFSLKLFVMEAFTVPTNAMAPTIVGWHHETTCPRCQGTLITSAPEPNDPQPFPPDPDRPGICLACRKVSVPAQVGADVHGPDRILVSKLHKPERWDVIVFRYPRDPTKIYTDRLVGLPGEKIYVKGESLWIDDVKTEMPAHLTGLEYTDNMGFRLAFGTAEDPVRLGPDEYFVLGDFSKSSSDSRDWGPVPAANIQGVVCARYWPIRRWMVLR